MTLIHLDGSHEEGGGQMLRTALALSAITGKAFEMTDIRKNRQTPGLKQQHLHGLKAVAELCDASVEGAVLGSSTVRFMPRELHGKSIEVQIETAGSMTLVLQSVLLPALLCKRHITIRMTGGSDVAWSPSFDYVREVFLPHLSCLGKTEARLLTRGYFPRGGGEAEIKVSGNFRIGEIHNIKPLDLDVEYSPAKIAGVSHASLDLSGAQVAERTANSAKTFLGNLPFLVEIQTAYSKTASTGSGMALWAIGIAQQGDDEEADLQKIILGADSLGEKGKKAEIVGKEAAETLLNEIKSKACVDAHLSDQLIPLLGLIGGRIRTSAITGHVKSNIYVTERFLDVKFDVDDDNMIISCAARTRMMSE